jgi:hypothetical protein
MSSAVGHPQVRPYSVDNNYNYNNRSRWNARAHHARHGSERWARTDDTALLDGGLFVSQELAQQVHGFGRRNSSESLGGFVSHHRVLVQVLQHLMKATHRAQERDESTLSPLPLSCKGTPFYGIEQRQGTLVRAGAAASWAICPNT